MSVIALKKISALPERVFLYLLPALALAGLLVLGFNFFSTSSYERASKATASTAGNYAAAATLATEDEDSPKAMNVANNGLILLRGARIISVDSDSIIAEVTWGSQNFIWNIKTERNTKFIQNGEKTTIEELRIGDVGTITGDLDTDEREPTVIADYVRF